MTTFKIAKTAAPASEDKTLEVYLKEDTRGVSVMVRDEGGVKWHIARLNESGRFYLFGGIARGIGLDVDGTRRIIVERD